jgi:hypothetical protein
MVSDILSLSAQIQVLWVDAILAVALVLNLRACGDWPDKGLVGHAMRAPAKAIPVQLAVTLAQ